MEKNAKIYLAGHGGMVGAAIYERLMYEGYTNIIVRASKELDLRKQHETEEFFKQERPEYVIMSAAKVGGIMDNISHPADFLYDNIQIQANTMQAAFAAGVKKLLFIASNCIYPRNCPQPMKEDHLMQGQLESSNEGYAIAKIVGIKV